MGERKSEIPLFTHQGDHRPMRKTTIIFDLDGTMINSEESALETWHRVLAHYGRHSAEEQIIALTIGVRVQESLRAMINAFELPVSAEQLYSRLSIEWEIVTANGIPAMPGLYELIDELAARQIRWGVATASDRPYTTKALHYLGLQEQCQAVATGDEVVHSKPAPEIYQLCAERLGVDSAECLAIEDSLVGHQAAAAAKMTVIAVPNPWTPAHHYTAAHHIYPSLHALLPHLDNLMSDIFESSLLDKIS